MYMQDIIRTERLHVEHAEKLTKDKANEEQEGNYEEHK